MHNALSRRTELNRQPQSRSPLVANRGSDSAMPKSPGPQGTFKANAQANGRSNTPRRGSEGGDAPPRGSLQKGSHSMGCLLLLLDNGTCPRKDSEYKQRDGPPSHMRPLRSPMPKQERRRRANATQVPKCVHSSRKGNDDSGSHAIGLTPKLALPRPRRTRDHDVGE